MGCCSSSGSIDLVTVSGDNRKATYTVKKATVPSMDELDSLDRESTGEPADDDRTAFQGAGSTKKVIVWDFDKSEALRESWRHSSMTSSEWPALSAQNTLEALDEDTLEGSEGEGLSEEVSRDPNPSALEAYMPGARVEYYSTTLGRWLAGQVDSPGAFHPGSELPCYQVVLGTGVRRQLRDAVELDILRPPLSKGMPVRVYIEKDAWWLDAVVEERVSATLLSYKVQLSGPGEEAEILIVSAGCLRPSFPEGCRLHVYVPQEGWRSGTALPSAGIEASCSASTEVAVCLDDDRVLQVPIYRAKHVMKATL